MIDDVLTFHVEGLPSPKMPEPLPDVFPLQNTSEDQNPEIPKEPLRRDHIISPEAFLNNGFALLDLPFSNPILQVDSNYAEAQPSFDIEDSSWDLDWVIRSQTECVIRELTNPFSGTLERRP
jgi:hypothetical protein